MKKLFLKLMRMIGFEPITNRPVYRGYVCSSEFVQSRYREEPSRIYTKITLVGLQDLRGPGMAEFELEELRVPWEGE